MTSSILSTRFYSLARSRASTLNLPNVVLTSPATSRSVYTTSFVFRRHVIADVTYPASASNWGCRGVSSVGHVRRLPESFSRLNFAPSSFISTLPQLTRCTLSSVAPPTHLLLSKCTPPLAAPPPSLARGFRLSTPHSAPPMVLVLFAKKVAQVVSILVARFARNRYRRKSDEEKKRFRERLARWKHWLLMPLAGLVSMGIAYLMIHLERAPYTKRLRLVTLTGGQCMELSKMELANQMMEHGPNFVDEKSRDYLNLKSVMDDIVKGNRDVPAVSTVDWKLHLVDRKDIENAFVLATGDIFFFTGLLKTMENNDEIACIMGHEMAHRVLGHDLEKATRSHLLDILVIALTSLVWLFIPDDIVAFLMSTVSDRFVRFVGELPYSRMLEEEADRVGLEVAAKACYDVRASSNIWTKLYLKNKLSNGADNELQKYFSTHPVEDTRADQLDLNIPAALHLRKSCSCPPLPHVDPRSEYHFTRKFIDSLKEDELESVRAAPDEDAVTAIMQEIMDKRVVEKALAEKAAEEERRRVELEKQKAEKLAQEKAEKKAKELARITAEAEAVKAAAEAEAEAAAAKAKELQIVTDIDEPTNTDVGEKGVVASSA